MNRFLWMALILFCLVFPANLPAQEYGPDQGEMSEVLKIINKYKQKGYECLGPVQYLGKNNSLIELYRHRPISYEDLDVIDKTGINYYVKKYDFVYVLQKSDHVILIRLDREDPYNA